MRKFLYVIAAVLAVSAGAYAQGYSVTYPREYEPVVVDRKYAAFAVTQCQTLKTHIIGRFSTLYIKTLRKPVMAPQASVFYRLTFLTDTSICFPANVVSSLLSIRHARMWLFPRPHRRRSTAPNARRGHWLPENALRHNNVL